MRAQRWKLWCSRREDSFGTTFDGTAFKGKSEYGVRFRIHIMRDSITMMTEPSRTGYTLTDSFLSPIKGVLGDPISGPSRLDLGSNWPMPGEVLITTWTLPKDKREETIRTINQFLEEAGRREVRDDA